MKSTYVTRGSLALWFFIFLACAGKALYTPGHLLMASAVARNLNN